jgi:VWFA-related protein
VANVRENSLSALASRWRFVVALSAIALPSVLTSAARAQPTQQCLEPGRLAVVRKQISDTTQSTADPKLRDELIAANEEFSLASRAATIDKLQEDPKKQNSDKPNKKTGDVATLRQENIVRVCSILNKRGWPMRSVVGKDGSDAFLVLLSRALPIAMQIELYPLVIDAFEKAEIDPGELIAGYVDRLRLSIGQKQLFGSQVYVRGGFLVMAPIEQPSRVDQRRAEFKMTPLRSYERFLEITYQKLLIRSVMEPITTPTVISLGKTSLESPAAVDDTGEPVEKVRTSLISFDVVLPDASDLRTSALEKTDFRVYENDRLVDVEFFSKTQAAFDLVLLLDLSGSTAEKVDLIRKSTKRFIAMKRPSDRLAIVTFDEKTTVVSPLDKDPIAIQDRVGKLRGGGGSNVWDAIKFSLDLLEQSSEKGRRKAVVLMSDGVDNQFGGGFFGPGARMGSTISYADLVEEVQRSTTSIFPIYLDTEGPDSFSKMIYTNARLGLKHLADQSAGNMYYAKKVEDLDDVYNRVLKDVGTVYTLGFTSPEAKEDNSWHTLRVEVPSLPGVKLKHRPGYFTR